MSFPLRERGLKPNDTVEMNVNMASFPLRERGLKPQLVLGVNSLSCVVPLAGTWIETFIQSAPFVGAASFPLRERGLKRTYDGRIKGNNMSFPLRERGLKLPVLPLSVLPVRVVPLAGTWIETRKN